MKWPAAPLNSIAQAIRGVTFKPGDVIGLEEEGAIAVFRTKNIQADLDLNDIWGLPTRFANTGRFLQDGDLLISTANSAHLVGKVCWVPQLPWPAVPGGFIGALRAEKAKLDSRYLYWWARTPSAQASIRACANQTTNIANLSIPRLMALEIPLPPLDEQRRIAAILDQADALRRAAVSTVSRLLSLRNAIFSEMFDLATTPRTEFSKLVEIGSGLVDPLNEEFADLPHIGPEHIVSGSGELLPFRTARQDGVQSGKFLFDDGCILYSKIRPALNKVAFAPGRGICSADMYPIRPRNGKATLDFVYAILQSQDFLAHAAIYSNRANIPKLNKDEILSYLAPAPCLDEQQEFSDRLAELKAAEVPAREQRAKLDALFASLQHRAFTGELTRSDERLLETA